MLLLNMCKKCRIAQVPLAAGASILPIAFFLTEFLDLFLIRALLFAHCKCKKAFIQWYYDLNKSRMKRNSANSDLKIINYILINYFIIVSAALIDMTYRRERKPLPYETGTYNYMREQDSPTKASILLQEDRNQYIEELKDKKDNFLLCLDLYRMSYQNQIPQKCLIHNNFITLYCENESKLLCVNCVYGSTHHKDHKVVPSMNSASSIARDNEENFKKLDDEIVKIRDVEMELKKNKQVLDDENRRIMKDIDQQFELIHKIIDLKHQEIKKNATQTFNEIRTNNSVGLTEILDQKKYWNEIKSSFSRSQSKQGLEIYKHLIFGLFNDNPIEHQKLIYMPSGQEIRNSYMKQIVELREMIEDKINISESQVVEKPRPKGYRSPF